MGVLFGVLTGCSEEVRHQTQITVVVESDLPLASQLAFVEIELIGRNAPDPQWFRIGEQCLNEGGKQVIGSFSLVKKVSNNVRLRVSGHAPDSGRGDTLLVTRTVDVTFKENEKAAVVIELSSACLLANISCGSGESCDPALASCAPIAKAPLTVAPRESSSCFSAVVGAPEFAAPTAADAQVDAETTFDDAQGTLEGAEDASVPDANPCIDGDGYCHPLCTFREDNDCLRERGDECATNGQCKSEQCAQGICCDRACSGTCERCDLDGTRGQCSLVDYLMSSNLSHCGGCNLACNTDNMVEASCMAGVCTGLCGAAFADCDRDKRKNGCEVNVANDESHCGACGYVCSNNNVTSRECLESRCVSKCRVGFDDCNAAADVNDGCEVDITSDPLHCNGCNKKCSYPYCYRSACAARIGKTTFAPVRRLSGLRYYGYNLSVPAGAVVALGAAFALPSDADASVPARVRFALYKAGTAGPDEYVTQTLDVPVTNADLSLPIAQRALTHAPVLMPKSITAGRYFLMILADGDVDIYTDTATNNIYQTSDPVGFIQATQLPPLRAEPGAVPLGFVFVAPDA